MGRAGVHWKAKKDQMALNQGQILYAVVARGPTVLVEWAGSSGNFSTVTLDLLGRLDQFTSRKISYSYGVSMKSFFLTLTKIQQ